MKNVSVVLVAIALLYLLYAVEHWSWTECRQVGHGVLYCLSR